jgi:Trypsin
MVAPGVGRVSPSACLALIGMGLGLAVLSTFGLILAVQALLPFAAYAETRPPAPKAAVPKSAGFSAVLDIDRSTVTNPGTPVGPGVKNPPLLQLSLPATTDSLGKLITPERKLTIELPLAPAAGVIADIPLSIGIQNGGSIKSAHVPSVTDKPSPNLLNLDPNSVVTSARGMVVTIAPDQQPAAPPPPAAPASFLDADSGLTDCQIPFEALKTRSPACQNRVSLAGRRCEQYSPSQFPEVVSINTGSQLCSGTLISKTWVITAAHCFGGNAPASTQVRLQSGDWTIPPAALAQTHVYLDNAVTLSNKADQTRNITKVVGYRNYGGLDSAPPFVGDIALVELSNPFPDSAVQPATLAQRGDFNQAVTLAGFGYSNADGGTLDQFNVTWPISTGKPSTAGQFSFDPSASKTGKDAFCEGDSGGPVFAGRYRGCKGGDRPPEQRPRLLQGLMSYLAPGDLVGTGNAATRHANACMSSNLMAMQDLTNADTRRWICTTTSNAAGNCR